MSYKIETSGEEYKNLVIFALHSKKGNFAVAAEMLGLDPAGLADTIKGMRPPETNLPEEPKGPDHGREIVKVLLGYTGIEEAAKLFGVDYQNFSKQWDFDIRHHMYPTKLDPVAEQFRDMLAMRRADGKSTRGFEEHPIVEQYGLHHLIGAPKG